MTKYAAFGTILRRMISGVYTAVAQVEDLEAPTLEAQLADSTDHDNSGAYRTSLSTLGDVGEVSMTLHFDPGLAGHVALVTALQNGTLEVFQLAFPDGATVWDFRAFVTQFQPGLPFEGKMTASVTLRGTKEPSTVGTGYGFLAQEDGTLILQEDGSPIITSV